MDKNNVNNSIIYIRIDGAITDFITREMNYISIIEHIKDDIESIMKLACITYLRYNKLLKYIEQQPDLYNEMKLLDGIDITIQKLKELGYIVYLYTDKLHENLVKKWILSNKPEYMEYMLYIPVNNDILQFFPPTNRYIIVETVYRAIRCSINKDHIIYFSPCNISTNNKKYIHNWEDGNWEKIIVNTLKKFDSC